MSNISNDVDISNELIAIYGAPPEPLTSDQIEDIKTFVRLRDELKRAKNQPK